MKKIAAVYDKDEEYGKRLAEYLNRKESLPFTMVFFTREEAVIQYAAEHDIEMLLLHEKNMSKNLADLPIPSVVYLTDKKEKQGSKEKGYVYQYQSSDHVIRDLVTCYETGKMQMPESIAATRPVTMIGIFSPIARCLKTSFALTLGQVLAKNQMVLYLNFEELAGFESLFNKNFSADLSDAVFYHAQGQLKQRLEGMIESWHNMDFLPPVRYPEDLFELQRGTVSELVKEIAAVSHYDSILLDMGSTMRFVSELLPLCQKIYMPIKEDTVSLGKIEAFETWLKMKKQAEPLQRVCKIKLPYYQKTGNSELYLEQMLWGEFGDYVRSLVQGEW